MASEAPASGPTKINLLLLQAEMSNNEKKKNNSNIWFLLTAQ